MFEPTIRYRIYCDAPGCIRLVMDTEDDVPLLIDSPDLDRVPEGLLTDDEGTPWVRGPRDRVMCPEHGHIIRRELDIAATHQSLFDPTP
ncbi:hypothetical protein AB0I72_11350 [Nocardiopsis sp. NPDC049922]|uniref:hypothetical protein n=1 Tax=Nocardiopsis sp. NPDC049922 TaxID=3155157 RepID=UPI0033EC0CB8